MALSLSTLLQFVAYLLLLHFNIGASIGVSRLFGPLTKMTLAAVPAGAAAFGLSFLGEWTDGPSLFNVLILGGATFAAMVVFVSLVWVFGVRKEINLILRRRRR